jgi:hypothetical protein
MADVCSTLRATASCSSLRLPVQALGAIQELLDKRGKGEPPIRVGAHVGDVIVTSTDDLLGHGVNVAARLQELQRRAPRSCRRNSVRWRATRRRARSNRRVKSRSITSISACRRSRSFRSVRSSRARRAVLVGWLLPPSTLGVLAYFSPQLYAIGMEYWRNRPQAVEEQQATQVQQAVSTPVETPASPVEEAPTRVPGYTFRRLQRMPGDDGALRRLVCDGFAR